MQHLLLARYFEHAHPETIPWTRVWAISAFSFSSFNESVFLKAVDGKAAFCLEDSLQRNRFSAELLQRREDEEFGHLFFTSQKSLVVKNIP